MAGPVANMVDIWKKKNFTYVPPAPPANLIESTSYTIDFTNRKFLNIGLDPTDKFNTIVQVITPSRYVNISPDFLRRIFSLMGNILSFVLEQPEKYKRTLFLETEFNKLSSMVYRGENVLVIESKNHEGCRILLNRSDLIRLQYLEWSIFETVVRKSAIIQPAVLKQFDMFLTYIDGESTKSNSPPKTPYEMISFIENLHDDIVLSDMQKNEANLISQLKMFASTQLAEHWDRRWNGGNSSKLFIKPPSQNIEMDSPMSPNIFGMHEDPITYATLRPSDPFDVKLMSDENHAPQPCDENDGSDCSRYFGALSPSQFITPPPSQSTFTEHPAPVRNVKRRLPHLPASPPFDVNDGPDFFNPIGTSTPNFNPTYTSTPCQPTFAEHPTPLRNVKRRLF